MKKYAFICTYKHANARVYSQDPASATYEGQTAVDEFISVGGLRYACMYVLRACTHMNMPACTCG
jgi:hypothetical protein